MTEPNLTTEIIGYRQWRVDTDLRLTSAGISVPWPWSPGDNTAECLTRRPSIYPAPGTVLHRCGQTPAPADVCECGLYGLHDPSEMWYGKGGIFLSSSRTDPLVSGVITAWGDMQVHWQGFRAQYARVAALALPESPRDRAVVEAVASRYGVPCVPAGQLARVAREFGDTIPPELRPEKPSARDIDTFITRALLHGGSYTATNWTFSPGTFAGALGPVTVMWSTAEDPEVPGPDPAASPLQRAINARRARGNNRQGPPRPKRAPKHQRAPKRP